MPKPTHKKKPFIDKKHAVSFQLIHRSQQVRITTAILSVIDNQGVKIKLT
jgi:hypothetical protein